MEASVQYNDFKGTAAADISDSYQNSVTNYLIEHFKSFDAKRYSCCGCSIYSGENHNDPISIKFICHDNKENKYVFLCPSEQMTYEEVFGIFKRFEVVIGKQVCNDIEISDDDWVDLE